MTESSSGKVRNTEVDHMSSKIEYLESDIELNPDDTDKRRKLVSAYLEEGRLEEARHMVEETVQTLSTTWSLYTSFHAPLIDAFINQGEIDLCQPLVIDAQTEFPEESKVQSKVKKARRALTQQKSASVFPPSLSVSEWWKGPHLLSDTSLDEWLPGQVVSVDDGHVHIHVASLAEDGYTFEEDSWTMPLDDMKGVAQGDIPDDLEGSHLEMGIYYDDRVVIDFHDEEA
jgi:hypothetical protein